MNYEENCKVNPDHVATPRWVVEDIYELKQKVGKRKDEEGEY